MNELIFARALGFMGVALLLGFIIVTTCDVQTLRNKIVYKLLNVWYNIYVLK